jgi:MFS family permease
LTTGFLLAGPVSGILSDRFGSRPFATGGMVVAALSFFLLEQLPVNFSYPVFAGILLLNGLAMGAFAAPNRAGVMNSLPAADRGVGGGMNATFQSSAQVLSIGIFFTLMIIGLSSALSSSLYKGLTAHGVPSAIASHASSLPPVSTLFAAFLGYNPVQHLVGSAALGKLSGAERTALLGHSFFPSLIAQPFHSGLKEAFAFSIGACLVAAAASWSRGKRSIVSARSRPRATEVAERPAPVVVVEH